MTSILFVALLLSEFKGGNKDDFKDVSGYYGPGSFLAWYITAASSVYHFEWQAYCQFLDLQPRSAHLSNGNNLDGVIIATIAYPAISTIDLTLKSCQGALGPAADAAECVVCSSWWLSAACTTAMIVHRRSNSRIHLSRAAAWFGLLVASSIALLVERFVAGKSPFVGQTVLNYWAIPLALLCILIVLSRLETPTYTETRQPLAWKFVFSVIPAMTVFAAIYMGSTSSSNDYTRFVAIPFPATASSLRDLDQIAAVGTAIAAALIPFVLSHIERYTKDKVTEQDVELGPILGTGNK